MEKEVKIHLKLNEIYYVFNLAMYLALKCRDQAKNERENRLKKLAGGGGSGVTSRRPQSETMDCNHSTVYNVC